MNWSGRRIRACIWNGLIVYDRSGAASGSHNEGLNAETANEIGNTSAVFIGSEVALIPGQPEGSIGQLDYESIELRLWWQSRCFRA